MSAAKVAHVASYACQTSLGTCTYLGKLKQIKCLYVYVCEVFCVHTNPKTYLIKCSCLVLGQ